ncbi:unnamed protein product [Rhizoctonia solani]|uniref:RRM domain-containing protein n=1 Tax=Rhizoctonia solani TaxID=456999 RepID=A0A8H2XCQ3_9AGAM|nr:unnamed protein product [Rhizoctonia solani]
MAGDEEMRSRSPSRSPSRGRNRSGTRSRSRSRSPITRTVFVKNLTRNIVHGHLRAVFSPYGDIRKIHMPTHQKSGQTKGSAHIEFYDSQAAKTAVTHMHTGLLDGATLTVEFSDPPRSPSPRRQSPRRQYSPRRTRRPPSPIRNRRPPPRRRTPPPRRYGGDSYRPRSLSPSRTAEPAAGAEVVRFLVVLLGPRTLVQAGPHVQDRLAGLTLDRLADRGAVAEALEPALVLLRSHKK